MHDHSDLPAGIPFKVAPMVAGQLDTYFDGIYKPWAALESDMIIFDNQSATARVI